MPQRSSPAERDPFGHVQGVRHRIFQTRLAEGEILTTIWVPKLSAEARWGYVKLARKSGEFAASLAVAVRDPARGYARVVLGAADGAPLILDHATGSASAGRSTLPPRATRSPPTSRASPTASSTTSAATSTPSPRCAR